MAETEEKTIGAAPPPQEEAVEEAVPEVSLPELPYTKDTLAALKAFFKGRSKNPELYTYTSGGDLEIKEGVLGRGKKKTAAGTILLQNFVPLDPAERALLDETRLQALATLDEAYEEEILVLKAAWEEYEATQSMRAVLNSNQRLTELDAQRNAARSQARDLVPIHNPVTRDILLHERYEERKMFSQTDPIDKELMGMMVVRMTYYPFPAEVEMGKYVPDESAKEERKDAEEEAAATAPNEMLYRQKLKDGRFARIFYDTDSDTNGFLSPMWPVDFTISVGGKDSRYSSPIQAYQVERVKELGNAALAESLMKTRSARTIMLLVRQVKGHPKDARGLWLKIYTAVYETFPNLAARLLATGSDTLVFADSREGPSSIGLAEKDSAVLDPAKWKGENAVGLAQETVRTRLREGTLENAPQADDVSAAVITEEEQEKAKVGAIIAARRGGRR
jgi:predicted NAD-dependent protein-ADP-ribosyltransferase YbiA (DUF1768 family)